MPRKPDPTPIETAVRKALEPIVAARKISELADTSGVAKATLSDFIGGRDMQLRTADKLMGELGLTVVPIEQLRKLRKKARKPKTV